MLSEFGLKSGYDLSHHYSYLMDDNATLLSITFFVIIISQYSQFFYQNKIKSTIIWKLRLDYI